MKLPDIRRYSRPARIYWAIVLSTGMLTAFWSLTQCYSFESIQWAKFLTLVVLAILAGAYPVRIPGTAASVTAGDTFVFLGAIFLGIPAAVLIATVDSFTSARHTGQRASQLIGTPATVAVTTFISSNLFYITLFSQPNQANSQALYSQMGIERLLLPLAVMTVSQYLLDGITIAATTAFRTHYSFWTFCRQGYLWSTWTMIGGSITAAITYFAVGQFGFLNVVLAVPVIYGAYALYKNYFDFLSEKTHAAAEIGHLHLSTVEALATAIDAKDQTSPCHVRRVQIYAAGMGNVFGLSASEIEALKAGALLHDIGKLAVPDHILNKPGRLTAAEFERMKIHTVVGADILSRVDFPYPVVPIVRHHHEQWNGQGYPDGLRGDQIPLTARILSVVDCFDSVREDRPFRRGMTREQATALLMRGAGTHFDPQVVELFLKQLPRFENEIVELGLGHTTPSEDGIPPVIAPGSIQKSYGRPAAYDQIRNANREIFALYEIARTFGSSLDVDDTMSIIVNKISHMVSFDTCVIYLYDELKAYAVAAHVAGKNTEFFRDRCVAPGEGVTGFALANRQHITRIDPSLDLSGIDANGECEYRAMVSFPLVRDERLLGAISIYSVELNDYTEEDIRLLETVTRLASDALANALNHAEAESNALTDPLTGLPNARNMYLRFDQEAARARRTGKNFQVIMLDLDDFKQVNDTFGHKTGDRMLREVAGLLQIQLREYDFLARYAGDEFVAIVQDLVGEQIDELKLRIENTIKSFMLHVRADHYARVGISVGSATFGIDGETLDQLLIAADQAMYRQKSRHKMQRNTASGSDDVVEILTGNLTSVAIN